jgi:hypothetical protein
VIALLHTGLSRQESLRLLLAIACCVGGPGAASAGETETAIAATCAKTSSATPASYAGCLFGRLATTEALKCLSGDCLGPNNTMVKFNQWLSHRLGGGGFKSKRYDQIFIVNLTDDTVSYSAETDSSERTGSSIEPGGYETLTGEGYGGFFNVYAAGIETSADSGSVIAFERNNEGNLVLNDISPRRIALANNCHQSVRVWLNYRAAAQIWVTRGAWTVPANGSIRLTHDGESVVTNNAGIYYYAESSELTWNGSDTFEYIKDRGDRRRVGMRFVSGERDGDGDYLISFTCH